MSIIRVEDVLGDPSNIVQCENTNRSEHTSSRNPSNRRELVYLGGLSTEWDKRSFLKWSNDSGKDVILERTGGRVLTIHISSWTVGTPINIEDLL